MVTLETYLSFSELRAWEEIKTATWLPPQNSVYIYGVCGYIYYCETERFVFYELYSVRFRLFGHRIDDRAGLTTRAPPPLPWYYLRAVEDFLS